MQRSHIDIYRKELDLNKDMKVKVSQIIIPKIQRPYAQGRLDGVCAYIRNTLLDEMFENFKADLTNGSFNYQMRIYLSFL